MFKHKSDKEIITIIKHENEMLDEALAVLKNYLIISGKKGNIYLIDHQKSTVVKTYKFKSNPGKPVISGDSFYIKSKNGDILRQSINTKS